MVQLIWRQWNCPQCLQIWALKFRSGVKNSYREKTWFVREKTPNARENTVNFVNFTYGIFYTFSYVNPTVNCCSILCVKLVVSHLFLWAHGLTNRLTFSHIWIIAGKILGGKRPSRSQQGWDFHRHGPCLGWAAKTLACHLLALLMFLI